MTKEVLDKIQEQLAMARDYGFDELYIKMPVKDAEKVVERFSSHKATYLPKE